MTVEVRRYDPATDEDGLWECKLAFERELGATTGDSAKKSAYEGKLDAAYRARYLQWVRWCLEDEPRALQVAVDDGSVVGYAFVLPERLSMIWDAAVLNELYVDPAYRATGTADRLLDGAIETASSQDLPLDRLVLDVDPDNERAYGFYRRHGFDSWGEMVAVDLP